MKLKDMRMLKERMIKQRNEAISEDVKEFLNNQINELEEEIKITENKEMQLYELWKVILSPSDNKQEDILADARERQRIEEIRIRRQQRKGNGGGIEVILGIDEPSKEQIEQLILEAEQEERYEDRVKYRDMLKSMKE